MKKPLCPFPAEELKQIPELKNTLMYRGWVLRCAMMDLIFAMPTVKQAASNIRKAFNIKE